MRSSSAKVAGPATSQGAIVTIDASSAGAGRVKIVVKMAVAPCPDRHHGDVLMMTSRLFLGRAIDRGLHYPTVSHSETIEAITAASRHAPSLLSTTWPGSTTGMTGPG